MSDVRIHDELLRWEFENSDFEKKAAQTLTTLQKLEKALNFKTVIDLARNFKLDGLAKDVDHVADRFSNLGIVGKRVLENLTDSAMRTGKKFLEALTIDDAKMGWGKYEEQVGAVQTLMNTTGLSAKEIQKYVDKFAIYSDETSYSLDQMVKAFSQMTTVADLSGTAADKATELKKIQDMIIGIANASAFAGKTGQEFQRTIYNITQSYQTGALKLMDWKSLQMAGTASKQLMEEMIKAGEDLYKQSKGKNGFKEGTVTVQNFSEVLKKGVISAEVMQNAFGKFGELAVAAAEGVQEGKYRNFADAVDDLAGSFSELSLKATESAWSAKTFKEAMASIHDTVSTQWSKSFQIIFGDYEEAKILWTNVAEMLYDVFGQVGIKRNEVLEQWAEENGRFFLILSLQNVLNAILDFVTPIKEAWNEVFAPFNGHQLALLTKRLQNFTLDLRLTGETQAKLRSITKDFAIVLKNLMTIFKNFARPILDFIGPFDQLALKALNLIKMGTLIAKALTEMTLKSEKATRVVGALMALLMVKTFLPKSIKLLFMFGTALKLIGIAAAGVLGILAYTKIRKLFSAGGKIRTEIEKIRNGFQNLRDTLKGFDSWKLEDYVNAVKNIASNIKNAAFDKLGDIGNFFKNINWKAILPDNIAGPIDKIIGKFTSLKSVIYNLSQSIQAGKLTLMDWKSIQLAGFGKEGWKPFYEGIVKAGVYINKFRDIAKTSLRSAATSIKNLFSKDAITGFTPFQTFLNGVKETFSSKEGFISLLNRTRNAFNNMKKIAAIPWKLSEDQVDKLKGKMKGLPALILNASNGFKGFLDKLKNPETIKTFGKTVTDIFSKVGSAAIGGFDTITNGKFHDGLTKLSAGFAKIRSVAGNLGSKGIETFYNVLRRLYSLIGSSSYVLSQGVGRIRESLGTLDVKVGAIGPRIINLANTIKSRLPGLLSPILKIIDGFTGKKYSILFNSVKAIINDIIQAISRLGGGGFKQFTSSLRTLFDTFASGAPITKTIEKLKDSISAFFKIFKGSEGNKVAANASTPLKSMISDTSGVLDTLEAFSDRVVFVIEEIKSVVGKITDVIPPEFYGHMKNFIKSILGILVLRTILSPFKSISKGITSFFSPFKALSEEIPKTSKTLSEGITNFFSPFKAISEGITNVAASIGKAVTSLADAIRGKWKAEAFEKRANGIFKLASAVGVLAAAVWIVAQIPIDNKELLYATGAILALMTVLLGFAAVYDKLGSSWLAELPKIESVTSKLAGSIFYFGKSTMIASLAISLVAMAGAIGMLIGPLKEITAMDPTGFWKGFMRIGAIMILLAGSVGVLGHAVKGAGPGILAASALLLVFNTIMRSFLKTMQMFGELFSGQNWRKVAKGAVAVTATIAVTMGSIAGVAIALSKFTANAKYVGSKVNPAAKALLATTVLLAGIVFFLNSMAKIIQKFRDLKVRATDIGTTMMAIAGILGGIALYAKILKTANLTEDIKTAGGLMVGFAGAMALLGVALHLYSNLDMEGIANALPAIIGSVLTLLGVIAAMGKLGGNVSIGSGLSILGFAALLTSLSVSLMILTLVDYAKLENASTSLSKVILSLGVALGLASNFTAKATAVVAFTFVIKELATSLVILSFIDYAKLESAANNLGKVLLAVAVAMAFSGEMALVGALQWIGIIGVILTLTASLLLLQNVNVTQLKGVATALGALEIVTGIMMAISSLGLATGGAAFASLAGATLLVFGLSVLLRAAGTIPDPEKAAFVLNSCTVFFTSIGIVIGILGKLQPFAGVIAAINVLEFLGILAIVVAAIGEFSRWHNDISDRVFEDLHNGFTEIGKFIGDIAGGFVSGVVDKAGESLNKIMEFIGSIQTLKDAITEEEANGINTTLGVVKDLLSISIPNDGGLAGFIFGNNNIGDFGGDIVRFGDGLRSFAASIQGIDASDEDIQRAISIADGLADLANSIPNNGDSWAAAIMGAKDLGEFAAQIAGGSIGGGASATNGDHGGSGRKFGDMITGTAKSTRGLGGAIKLFTDSIKDIPDDAWKTADKAIKASESIADFAQHVPKSGGFAQKITGVHDLSQFALSLVGDGSDGNPGFVTSVTKLVETTTSMPDPEEAVKKIQSTQALIDFFKSNTSVWDSLTTSMGNYHNGWNPLAVGIQVITGYAKELGVLQEYDYIDPATLTNITNAIVATQPAIEFFKDNVGYFDLIGGLEDVSIAGAISMLKEYAHELALLGSYNLNTEQLASIATALENADPLLTFYDDRTSWLDSACAAARRFFDKGNNPLADAIKMLIPYAQALNEYANEISGIEDMQQVVRSTVAAGNLAKAIQDLFSAQNLYKPESFGYVKEFGDQLGSLATSLNSFANNFGDSDLGPAISNVNLAIDMFNAMEKIGPLSADGFIESLSKAADIGLDEFCDKFKNSESELNIAISDFLGITVGILSRKANQDRLKTGAENLFKGYLDGQNAKLEEAKKALEKFIQDLPGILEPQTTAMKTLGLKMAAGLIEGFKDPMGFDRAKNVAVAKMREIMLAIGEEGGDDIFDKNIKGDASWLTRNLGLKEGEGFIQGIIGSLPNIGQGIDTFGNFVTTHFNNAFGEGGSILRNFGTMAGNIWSDASSMLTGSISKALNIDFEGMWKDAIYDENGNTNGVIDIAKNLLAALFKTGDDAEKEAEKKAKTAGDNLNNISSKSANKAVQDAKEAGKEILDEEDAFWIALLTKKRMGANAAEYQDMKVKDFEKKMLEEVNRLVDDYKEKLNSTTDDILGMIGLFDKVEDKVEEAGETFGDIFKGLGDSTTKLEGNIEDLFRRVDTVTKSDKVPVSGDELMANLQDQIDKYTEYYDIQDELAKRINNDKLKKTLREMTIDSIEELKALNEMSDKELDEYVELFEKRIEVAGRDKAKKDTEESPTAELLTKNLEDQVAKYKEYKEVVSNLNARVTSKKLRETLTNMGIDNMDQLKAIESMTDSELDHYTELFDEKYSLSRDVAEIRLEETKQETEDKLNELLETTGLQLDTFLTQFDGTLASLTDIMGKHLSNLTLGANMGHIAQELIKPLLDVFNNASMDAETKVIGIQKAIESAAIAGVDITDQYTQGIITLLNNTEMTTDEKLKAILQLMMDSQLSLAQSSTNLAQTTKDTIAKILSDAEARNLVNNLLTIVNDGVMSAAEKMERIRNAVQQAGESNVQLVEIYRSQIAQLLAQTNADAEAQIQVLLGILNSASADYQAWALQDIGLLSADLLSMSQVSQNSLGGMAKASYNDLKDRLHDTTGLVGEELDNLTEDVGSALNSIASDGISTQETFNSALENIVTSYGVTAKQQVQDTVDAIDGMYSSMKSFQSSAYASAGGGSSRSRNASSGKDRDAISLWESATGRTLSDAHRQFAMNGGTIVGGGGSQIIKDGRYWDDVNHASYDLASGAAHYAVQGYSDGISNGQRVIYAAGAQVYKAFSDGLTGPDALDEHSPSKRMMEFAKFALLGWIDGIDHYSHLMSVSGQHTADSYIDVFNESMRNIEMPPDLSPVITPVIDMSRAEDAMNAIDNLFNTEKSYSMASDIKRVADIAARAKAEASKAQQQAAPQTTNMNFTQNNYSPKALSKLDIYRQTKNQFAQMKGALA